MVVGAEVRFAPLHAPQQRQGLHLLSSLVSNWIQEYARQREEQLRQQMSPRSAAKTGTLRVHSADFAPLLTRTPAVLRRRRVRTFGKDSPAASPCFTVRFSSHASGGPATSAR